MMRRLRRDDGMTLVELLLTIVMLGGIAAAITLSLSAFSRSKDQTSAMLTTTRYAQTLNLWFPADVQSALPGGISRELGYADGCPGLTGQNLVWLALHPADGGPFVVSYRLVDGVLVRATCSDTSVPASVHRLVERVEHASVDIDGDRVALHVRATVDDEHYDFTVVGTARATTTPSTLPSTTTTVPPVTSEPPVTDPPECTLNGVDALVTNRGGQLRDRQITVTVSPGCAGLALDLRVVELDRVAALSPDADTRRSATFSPPNHTGFGAPEYTIEVRRVGSGVVVGSRTASVVVG